MPWKAFGLCTHTHIQTHTWLHLIRLYAAHLYLLYVCFINISNCKLKVLFFLGNTKTRSVVCKTKHIALVIASSETNKDANL